MQAFANEDSDRISTLTTEESRANEEKTWEDGRSLLKELIVFMYVSFSFHCSKVMPLHIISATVDHFEVQ